MSDTNMGDTTMGEANSGTPVEKGFGGIPFVNEILARRRVARLEQGVGRFRVRTSKALSELAIQCAQQAELQASALAAREAVLGLSPEAREPLVRRIEQAETRVDAMKAACHLPRTVAPEVREPGESDLSGGGDER